MMTLFSIPVAEKSGVSVACFKIIKPFFFFNLATFKISISSFHSDVSDHNISR